MTIERQDTRLHITESIFLSGANAGDIETTGSIKIK